jgi:hypothetical protein
LCVRTKRRRNHLPPQPQPLYGRQTLPYHPKTGSVLLVCRVCPVSLLFCVEGMGAAASANVRGRLEYIAYLEAEVQMLRAEKQEALRKVMRKRRLHVPIS